MAIFSLNCSLSGRLTRNLAATGGGLMASGVAKAREILFGEAKPLGHVVHIGLGTEKYADWRSGAVIERGRRCRLERTTA